MMISMSEVSLLMAAADGGSAASSGALGAFYAIYFGIMGMFGALYCGMFLFGLIALVLWLWMLIDCISRKDFQTENDRLLWVLILFFAGALGALIYYFVVKRKLDSPKWQSDEADRHGTQ
jgi:phosphotransferase system  glucose/maltose/N-acetylglucosamine-specific IIC component